MPRVTHRPAFPRTQRALAAATLLTAATITGCRQDMHNQPKFFPQRGTSFYADGRSVRPQVPNTVAREQADRDSYFYTGMVNGQEADGMPVPVTAELIARGQEQFNVYCTPCHSRTGYGNGMIVQRGYEASANLHSTRLREAPLGHFFAVITNGYGAMPEYKAQVTPIDRWAIAAYIRALQLSQNAKAADAPATAQVRSLTTIAEATGMPASWADSGYFTHRIEKLPNIAPAAVPPTPTASATPATSAAAAPASPAPVAEAAKPNAAPASAEPAKQAKPPAPKGNAAAGKEVYLANCSVCHQPTLEGRPPKIPGLLNIIGRTSEDHVRSTIQEGRPDARPMMPAFGEKLSPQQIDDLIAFLKTNKPAGE